MYLAANILLIAAAIFVVWLLLSARYDIIIVLRKDGARLKKGKITAGQLAEIAEVCKEFELTSGWIGIARQRKQERLTFSRNLPPDFCQRVRNLWQFH